MPNIQLAGFVINELHQKAMDLADEAFRAMGRKDLEQAQEKYLAAFECEQAAAMLFFWLMPKIRNLPAPFYSGVLPLCK